MADEKRVPDEVVDVKEEEQVVVPENAEETVCAPDFSCGCIDQVEK